MTAIEIANTDILSADIEMPNQNVGTFNRLPLAGRSENVAQALSRKQKAAIIVRLLLAEGAELSLQALPEALQTEMIRQISGMRYVDRATLKAVVDEFVAEIEDIGLAFPNGIEGALTVLDGAISPATAARVRKLAGVNLCGDPWDTIAKLEPEVLLSTLQEESIEIAAVLLSKLKVSIAADLLGQLPGPRARKVAYAVSQTGSIAPDVVEKIGRSLADQLGARPPKAFDNGPVARVGAILNASPAATRDDVLDGLDQDDTAFASAVRKAIFTFADIPARVEPADVPKVTKDIDQAVLVTALTAATGDLETAADFILGAMSKRLAEQIREEMAERGKVKTKDGEAAMAAIVAQIRELETAGEISLIIEEEEED
ncbi:flagellar motor switch protein FliG [Aliiroseovarius sp. S1339]|uniref:flagellar motor switch protein FliG n=1 Tax=Aliiroseovarius sp. S1339 TaxID=2936990 RepID=UPI0020BF5558|nr:FliG C-terminal domain-containing protein [Aliiroseovarius sp. S1339]MCK8464772.1 flagellar motor switch protein FliG [Aliiroseovarius sp. S1339]